MSVAHKVINGKYGKHIVNENKDDIETLVSYVCNLENMNKFKIIIGSNNIKTIINQNFNLEDETKLPFVKGTVTVDDEVKNEYYSVKELSEKIRHRLYHIKHNDKVVEVFKELFSDINAMVNVKQKDFLIGLDKSKKNIDTIYNTIKETFDMLEINNYTIYVYEGVEKWEEK